MSWGETINRSYDALASWEGKLPKMTNDEYHKRPELSSSDLKHMLKSPLHFKGARDGKNEDVERNEPNASFDLGSCVHSAVLEQSTDLFVTAPPFDRRTKAGREDFEAFRNTHHGRYILTPDQHCSLKAMFEVFSSNERASLAVSDSAALIEESFVYRDRETGLHCKFRPDIMRVSSDSDGIEIDDYKTAISAAPHEFSKACARYRYHLSAAHYIVGAERLYQKKVKQFRFIVQEKTAPFALAFYRMNEADIERSIDLRNEIMARILKHTKSNEWPDWSERDITLTLPGYAFNFKEVE